MLTKYSHVIFPYTVNNLLQIALNMDRFVGTTGENGTLLMIDALQATSQSFN